MRRREFITLVGGAVVSWPIASHAQQPAMPVIGWLSSISPGASELQLAAFRKALGETGYVDHRNVGIEYRWAEGRYDRLPAMAADLVAQRVAVIATCGGEVPALAAKAATSMIPIVMVAGGDPVQEGVVTNLNRPGGNITGATRRSSSRGSFASA
jgi:putative tryptophan/tyrosine transport system substrate-binding protein